MYNLTIFHLYIQSFSSNGVTYDNTLFQCQFCLMGFSDSRILERHLWQNHPQLAEIIEKQMKPYLSGQIVNSFGNSPGKLKLPLKPPVPVSSQDKVKIMTAKSSKGSPKSEGFKSMEGMISNGPSKLTIKGFEL